MLGHLRKAAATFAAILVAAFLALPASADASVHSSQAPSTAVAAMPRTKVIADCQEPAYKPRRIILTCADHNLWVEVTTWQSWTRERAVGQARYVYNDCRPTCAAGHTQWRSARVTLRRVLTAADGTRLFRHLRVDYFDPGGTHSLAVTLPVQPLG